MTTKPFSFLPRRGPAVALLVTISATTGAVYYSHYAQVRDKAVMRQGVERDKERMRQIRRQKRDNTERQQHESEQQSAS